GSVSTPMAILLGQLASAGTLVVVAGGNGIYTVPSDDCYPWSPVSKFARAPGTIGVSAYGTDHQYKTGFQYGPAIDFSAPTDVLSTAVEAGAHTIEPFGGTSAATPHVAAAIAVLLSAGFQKQHVLTRMVE